MAELAMARISVTRKFNSPLDRVWAHLADLGQHHTWMKDAESIEFLSPKRSGVGTKMEVPTRVGPFRTRDVIEVIEWTDRRSITVSHKGLVKGIGRFVLEGAGEVSVLTWEEELQFPWWLGGRLTAWLARPILKRIWAGNLRRLAKAVEN